MSIVDILGVIGFCLALFNLPQMLTSFFEHLPKLDRKIQHYRWERQYWYREDLGVKVRVHKRWESFMSACSETFVQNDNINNFYYRFKPAQDYSDGLPQGFKRLTIKQWNDRRKQNPTLDRPRTS